MMQDKIVVATAMVASLMLVIFGRLAQLVRAAALHAVGQGFESLVAHPSCLSIGSRGRSTSFHCCDFPSLSLQRYRRETCCLLVFESQLYLLAFLCHLLLVNVNQGSTLYFSLYALFFSGICTPHLLYYLLVSNSFLLL